MKISVPERGKLDGSGEGATRVRKMPTKDKKVNDDWYNVDPYVVSEDKGRIKVTRPGIALPHA